MFEERYVEVESKIKQDDESAVTGQKPNETKSAAHNLGKDANGAAAKEKAKITGDVPRSQNNKNEKIKEGDHEIRRLIEERRSITKEDRHQLREVNKSIKKCIRDRKRTQKTKNAADSGGIQRNQKYIMHKFFPCGACMFSCVLSGHSLLDGASRFELLDCSHILVGSVSGLPGCLVRSDVVFSVLRRKRVDFCFDRSRLVRTFFSDGFFVLCASDMVEMFRV